MNYNYAIFDTLGAGLETRQSRTVITPLATSPVSLATVALASYPKSSGRWYFTMLCWGDEALEARIGIAKPSVSLSTALGGDSNAYALDTDGSVYTAATGTATGTTFGKGDEVGVLLDITTNSPFVQWFVNGVSVYTQPLTDTGPWMIALSLGTDVDYGVQCFLNSGQRAFNSPPTGADNGWYAPIAWSAGARLADTAFMTAPDYDPPNFRYGDLLTGESDTQAYRGLTFWPWGRTINSGAMTIDCVNDGSLDQMLRGSVRDMDVLVQTDDGGNRTAIYTAIVDSIVASGDDMATITCRDSLGLLQVPLQRQMIPPNADPDAANTPRPVLLGACRNVPVKQTDAINYVFAASDSPMMGIGFCRVSGYPLDPASGDFTLNDGKTDITLAADPGGIVTLDASSIGGQQLPDVTDDIYGGSGSPFTGSDGSSPTGWDDTGSDVAGADPVMLVGDLTFPVVTTSQTIYAEMPVSCVGVTGYAALRIQWLDSKGDVIREKLSALFTATTSPTYEMASVLDSAPDGGVAGRFQAVAFDHSAGIIRVGDIRAYYVKYGARTDIPTLVNGDFSSGDLTGWDTAGGDTSKWEYQSSSSQDGQDVTQDNVIWKGTTSGSNSGMLINTGKATGLSEGDRINATCSAALYKGEDRYHPTAQVGIIWYDATDKAIGWSLSPGLYKGHKGYYSKLSVTGYAPANVSYARLFLNAGMSPNNDGGRGPLFAACSWDAIANPSVVDSENRTQVDIGTFATASDWDFGPGWTLHAASGTGPSGAEYAEHLP